MIKSNGHESRNRLPEQDLETLVSPRERAESNGTRNRTPAHVKSTRQGPSTSKRVWLVAAAVLVLVGGVGFASLGNSESDVDAEERSRVLAVQTVPILAVTSYQAAREYTGAIVARRTSELGFELPGKLTELHVNDGDSVTGGAVLAQLDTEHLETNRRRVVARRAQAAAQLDEMVTGPRDEDIAAARARVESFQAEVELLRLQTARHKRLVATNATSQDEYEQYAFGLKARDAQLNEARHNLEELLNGTRKEQIEAQRAVVAELDAAIADIDVDLRKSKLTAPFSGTIARRLADDGTVVEAGQPVFRLVEDQALEAWIGLPAHATSQLTEGSTRRLRIHGDYFDATVASRFPEVDPATRTRTVVLELAPSASTRVVHGQVVRLELEETVQINGFWLPSTALTMGARGLWTALVVEGEAGGSDSAKTGSLRVARRDVEVLHTESDRVLVRGTLNPSDRVVTGGTHRVVPGQLVRLAK
jgi:RND family efflux transporter MFP subunit